MIRSDCESSAAKGSVPAAAAASERWRNMRIAVYGAGGVGGYFGGRLAQAGAYQKDEGNLRLFDT